MEYDIQRIIRERTLKGWNQTDFARVLGTAQSTISQIESGKVRPMPRTLEKMAKALSIPMKELILDEERAS